MVRKAKSDSLSKKAYKFRIYPSEEQKIFFAKTFGCTRFIYNQMLADKISYYEKTKGMLHNTPAQYKEKYLWLKEVDSLALTNAQKNLETAYDNFFKNTKIGFPKFKAKRKTKKAYTTNNVNNNIKIVNNYLKIPKIKSLIKIKIHRNIPDNYKLKSVTISQSASGKYFASILFEYENQVIEKKSKTFVGLDFSMHELYVDSEGIYANYPKYYRQEQLKLAREQRKFSKMEKGSKNREKQRIKLAIVHKKVANQRKDFLHKLSKKLIEKFDCVCIEDLNMKALSQVLNFGKSVMDNGWGMFVNFLDYKSKEVGKKLVKVGKYFASSQICSNCGYKNKEVKDLSIRQWKCPNCKVVHDRDINAAINIRNEGMRIVLG